MPIIDSREVRLLRINVMKLVQDLVSCNMTEAEFRYFKEEMENQFNKCLRKEQFNGN